MKINQNFFLIEPTMVKSFLRRDEIQMFSSPSRYVLLKQISMSIILLGILKM